MSLLHYYNHLHHQYHSIYTDWCFREGVGNLVKFMMMTIMMMMVFMSTNWSVLSYSRYYQNRVWYDNNKQQIDGGSIPLYSDRSVDDISNQNVQSNPMEMSSYYPLASSYLKNLEYRAKRDVDKVNIISKRSNDGDHDQYPLQQQHHHHNGMSNINNENQNNKIQPLIGEKLDQVLKTVFQMIKKQLKDLVKEEEDSKIIYQVDKNSVKAGRKMDGKLVDDRLRFNVIIVVQRSLPQSNSDSIVYQNTKDNSSQTTKTYMVLHCFAEIANKYDDKCCSVKMVNCADDSGKTNFQVANQHFENFYSFYYDNDNDNYNDNNDYDDDDDDE